MKIEGDKPFSNKNENWQVILSYHKDNHWGWTEATEPQRLKNMWFKKARTSWVPYPMGDF